MNKTPFCLWPWFHQVVKTDGSVKPCCVWKKTDYSYDKTNFFDGKFMNNLRESFINNIPHNECHHCVYTEQTNNRSYRQLSFIRAKELNINIDDKPTLHSQEVRLSNICNLKCRMCNQRNSSKWIADEVAMGIESVGLLEANWELSDDQVNTIEVLTFTGGEPMMHQNIICKELTKLKNANRLHLLILIFNTNMTVPISDELINLISCTKRTSIGCSIDSIGKINEYIRSDTEWSDVENNICNLQKLTKRYRNINISINMVYNIFSAGTFTDLLNWSKKYTNTIFVSLQFNPDFQDARNLPDSYKKELIDMYTIDSKHCDLKFSSTYETIIKHLQNIAPIEYNIWKNKFKTHNDFLDMRRHTNLNDVLPKLYAIINE